MLQPPPLGKDRYRVDSIGQYDNTASACHRQGARSGPPAGSAPGRGVVLRQGREPGTILVVDDEPEVLRTSAMLRAAGYSTLSTGEHRELSSPNRAEGPHLVRLDLMLPGTDGIRQMEQLPGLPVIFISAYGRDETIARAVKAGAADYIVKPFPPPGADGEGPGGLDPERSRARISHARAVTACRGRANCPCGRDTPCDRVETCHACRSSSDSPHPLHHLAHPRSEPPRPIHDLLLVHGEDFAVAHHHPTVHDHGGHIAAAHGVDQVRIGVVERG